MDDLTTQKHFYEQQAYAEIRAALQEQFLISPELFMAKYNARPEDMDGVQLRSLYPNFLVADLPISSKHEGFRKRFFAGEIFPVIFPNTQHDIIGG